MRVRVKEGQTGFIYGVQRIGASENKTNSDEFVLEEFEATNGQKITVKQQFSDRWMEEVDAKPEQVERKKPGPKPKVPQEGPSSDTEKS